MHRRSTRRWEIAAIVPAAAAHRHARPRGKTTVGDLANYRQTRFDYSQCSQEVQVHLQRKAWRHFVLAAALVTFALPLAGPLTASPANAQVGSAQPFSIGKAFPTACTPSTAISSSGAAGTTSTDCYVEVVEPGANFVSNSESSFNMIGSEHTFTFICDAL